MDGGLWNSDLGHKYLQEQHAAVKRGVKIRRIFIFDRPEFQHDKDLLNILRRHVAVGVEVRTLAPGLDRYSFIDFIVLDSELVYQSQPESRLGDSRPIIATTTLVTKPDRVLRRIQQYHELWESATGYVPPTTRAARRVLAPVRRERVRDAVDDLARQVHVLVGRALVELRHHVVVDLDLAENRADRVLDVEEPRRQHRVRAVGGKGTRPAG